MRLEIKGGYACHYRHYQKEQSKLDRVLNSSAETEARAKKIGLWSVPAIPPWDYRRNQTKTKKNIERISTAIYALSDCFTNRPRQNKTRRIWWYTSEIVLAPSNNAALPKVFPLLYVNDTLH